MGRDVFSYPNHDASAESISRFCDQFLNGELRPHVIKQAVPEKDDSSAVVTLVHDTYRAVVHDQTKDVVVIFYLPADECPHCQVALDVFASVADSLAEYPDLVFSKIDMYANAQVPSVRVNNFPTIQMYTMRSKFRELTFEGQRSEEKIKEWVLDNLTNLHNHLSEEERKLGLGEIV